MNRYFLVFFFGLFSIQQFSQVVNNLVVFSNEGLKFTLIMNGEKYNTTPETKVRVVGLVLKKYQVKIIFEDSKFKDVNTTLTFFNTGYECQFALNKHGNKKHKMEFFTQTVMEGFEKPQSTQNNSNNIQNSPPAPAPATAPITPSTIITGSGTLPNNTSNSNIGILIGNEQFNIFKNEILKQVSEATKQEKAMNLINKNSLLSSQVKETMKLFSTDQAKLDFAKKAWPKTKDKENYTQLLDALTTNSLKEDLKKFIESHQ